MNDATGPPFSLPSPTSPIVQSEPKDATSESNTGSSILPKKRPSKGHVAAACVNCQRAHLACETSRPCKRCVQTGREDTCVDAQHKKRGRPRRRDRLVSVPEINISVTSGVKALPGIFPSGLVQSSFIMTSPPGAGSDNSALQKCTITLFLSMETCCARVSDETLDLLGIYPHEFAHRSLYEFVHPEHSERIARVHRCLLDNATAYSRQADATKKMALPPTQRTTADCFASTSPATLLSIANGSQTIKDNIALKTSSGNYIDFEARFYLGGGLGADLFVPSTLEQLYIVCVAATDRPSSPPRSIITTPTTTTTAAAVPVTSSLASRLTPTQPVPIPLHEQPLFRTRASDFASLLSHSPIPSESMADTTDDLLPMFDTSSPSQMSHMRRPSSYDDGKSIPLPSSGHRQQSSSSYVGSTSSPASAELSYPPEDNSGALLDDSDIEMITLQASQPVSWSPSSPVETSSNRDLNSPSSADVLSRSRNRLDSSRGPPRVSTRQPEYRMEPEHHRKRDNTWVNPSTVYFEKIPSSRLSPDSSFHSYRSPSAAMMDAVKCARPSGGPNSVLNPVATHLGVPNIHPPILRTRPFASTNTL